MTAKTVPGHGDFTPVTRVELRRVDLVDFVLNDPTLRECALVRALGNERAASVLKLGIGRRYPDKVQLFGQGSAGDSLVLVLKGEARLFTRIAAETLEVGTVTKGDVFGEAEVIGDSGERSCTALAAGELDVVELPRRALRDAAHAQAPLLDYLTALAKRRQTATDEMASFLKRW